MTKPDDIEVAASKLSDELDEQALMPRSRGMPQRASSISLKPKPVPT